MKFLKNPAVQFFFGGLIAGILLSSLIPAVRALWSRDTFLRGVGNGFWIGAGIVLTFTILTWLSGLTSRMTAEAELGDIGTPTSGAPTPPVELRESGEPGGAVGSE